MITFFDRYQCLWAYALFLNAIYVRWGQPNPIFQDLQETLIMPYIPCYGFSVCQAVVHPQLFTAQVSVTK